jgi:hypothetical protein
VYPEVALVELKLRCSLELEPERLRLHFLDATTAVLSRHKLTQQYAAYVVVVMALFASLVATGTTTSSIGIFSVAGGIDASVVRGNPQPVRADEYMRSTPSLLGSFQHSSNLSQGTPLEISNAQGPPSRSERFAANAQVLMSLDSRALGAIYERLPIDQRFAATWWTPTLYLFLFLPLLLALIGVPLSTSIIGTLLIWASAVNAWWSGWPADPIAAAALAGALIALGSRMIALAQRADNSNRAFMALGLALAALGGARGPQVITYYQPWSVPIFLVFVAIMFGYLLTQSQARRARLALFAAVLTGAVLSTLVLYVSLRSTILAIADTVYPGERRVAVASVLPAWAGSVVWKLQEAVPQNGNQSEAALGLTIALLFAVTTAIVCIKSGRIRRNPPLAALVFGLTVAGVLLLWGIVTWPSLLTKSNPLTLIPPGRMVEILGPIALVLYTLSLAMANRVSRSYLGRFAIALTACAAVIFGVRSSQEFQAIFLPQLTMREIVVSSCAVAIALALPYFVRPTWVALLPLACFTVFTVHSVLPIQHGTGTMIHSPIADEIRRAAGEGGGRWASDGVIIDALLLSSGVPQVSGQQSNGPNRDAWKILDPTGGQTNSWNRGASYVTFAWNNSDVPVITNPSHDVIQVAVSPCSPSMATLRLEWILTTQILEQPCATLFSNGMWQGQNLNIYRVSG